MGIDRKCHINIVYCHLNKYIQSVKITKRIYIFNEIRIILIDYCLKKCVGNAKMVI